MILSFCINIFYIHVHFCIFFLESPLMKLYIGNISYETTKEDLEEFFEPYGGVEDVYIPLDRETGAPRGFAFASVERKNAENVMDNLNGVELRNRVIEVKESLPRGQKAPPRQYKRPSSKFEIYHKYLPPLFAL